MSKYYLLVSLDKECNVVSTCSSGYMNIQVERNQSISLGTIVSEIIETDILISNTVSLSDYVKKKYDPNCSGSKSYQLTKLVKEWQDIYKNTRTISESESEYGMLVDYIREVLFGYQKQSLTLLNVVSINVRDHLVETYPNLLNMELNHDIVSYTISNRLTEIIDRINPTDKDSLFLSFVLGTEADIAITKVGETGTIETRKMSSDSPKVIFEFASYLGNKYSLDYGKRIFSDVPGVPYESESVIASISAPEENEIVAKATKLKNTILACIPEASKSKLTGNEFLDALAFADWYFEKN